MGEIKLETPGLGDILREEFLLPLELSAYRLAKDINVSTSTVLDIVHNRRALSVEMALRFSRYFGNSWRFWLNLQNEIEVRKVMHKKENEITQIKEYSSIAD